MSKINPFDYVKSINKKGYKHDLSGYNPFLTNRAMASYIDTIMFAEEMNQHHQLPPQLQYDFYYYGVRKASRFDPVPKQQDPEHLSVVMDFYSYSRQKALEALQILTEDQIYTMILSMDKGGNQ